MSYLIEKSFDFCYGHRVWSQELNPKFSLDSCLACRHLHGHQGQIIVTLEADCLKNSMVTDFKHLNWMKKFLDDFLDHKFILDENDPVVPDLFPFLTSTTSDMLVNLVVEEIFPGLTIKIPAPWVYNSNKVTDSMKEILEGLIFVNFVPTSENFSKWIYDIVVKNMSPLLKQSIRVKSVEFKETPKTSSTYLI